LDISNTHINLLMIYSVMLQTPIDGERLFDNIVSCINKPIGFDAVMRVRCSAGNSILYQVMYIRKFSLLYLFCKMRDSLKLDTQKNKLYCNSFSILYEF
jgi:hypothetical protein